MYADRCPIGYASSASVPHTTRISNGRDRSTRALGASRWRLSASTASPAIPVELLDQWHKTQGRG